MRRRRRSNWVSWVSLSILAIVAGSASAGRPGERNSLSGFSASIGMVGTHLVLQESAVDLLGEGGIDLSDDGVGMALQLQQQLGSNFALGLRLASSHHAGEDDDRLGEVHFGQGMLEMIATPYRGKRTAFYFIGGIGGVGLELIDTQYEDVTLNAGAIDFGGGIDVDLSRRWSFGFAYRVTSFTFDQDTLVARRVGEPDRIFDGAGIAHDLSFRWSFGI